MSDNQAGTGPNPSPHNVGVASGQTVRIQQVLSAAPQNVNVLTSRGQQFVITSQVNVPALTQVLPTIPSNNAGIQQGVTRILNIAPSSRVNVVGVPQVPGRTASVQLTNTSNNASGEVSGRGAVSLVAISQPSAINAASHPTLVSTLSSPPRQRTATPLGIMQSSPTLVLASSHNVRSPSSVSHPISNQSSVSGIPRKRIRLVEMQERPPPNEEIAAARKTVLDHKTGQMSAIREQFADRTAELFFLQLGGNMMDYYSWRKRPPSAQFLHFLRTNPLDPEDDDEDLTQVLSKTLSAPSTISSETKSTVSSAAIPTVSTSTPPPPLPPPPLQLQPPPPPLPVQQDPSSICISVPSVSATPSSVASTSPIKQIKSPAIVRQQPKPPSISSVYDTSIGSQEQIAEKAKQEAHVMQRIVELQKEGLWSEKRLPKVQEPPRAKAHWDYLVEEMVWLAADFAQERKWKKAAAKKCARAIQKYFQEKAIQAQKAEKTQELRLRKIANFIAKEVKTFWSNVEKLVEYKQQTRLEEKRKKVLDQHLSFIVDQTERYSTWLAESMNKSGMDNVNPSVPPSVNSSVLSSPARQDGVSDDEFQPNQSSTDDEETIAKEEEEEGEVSQSKADEIEMLKRESELPLEDLLKELPEEYLEHRDDLIKGKSDDEKSSINDDEFVVESDGESSDDEETIQEQERAEGTVDHKEELATLEAEGEMSLEDLLAKYGGPECLEAEMEEDHDNESDDKSESESDAEGDDGEVSDMEEDDDEEEDDEEEEKNSENEDVGLKSLLDDTNASASADNDKNAAAGKEISDVAALAESIQPKGNTLSSTNVVTTIPFLLKHTLREYQHIGLDWLVTMFDRKLNGILADEMGLGKTIQTISLLAHLACEKGNWGPHLIIVPTSVMLNWEMEFKKWCPAFKILTYYGTQKERKQKRTGWTKPNAFHVCITSYKLVIQDHQSFRRKKWKYLILDEAQNIKNFKSQRWQLLLNFQTQRRLLLTGTPLQNNLMELWSLMHFLMPNVFQSHREFKEWFSNPVTGMIEGNSEYNDSIIKRLHKVLRPFLLRRLKTEVEKQLPKKYEHIVMCRLSKRQRFLYDDFMSRAKTRETLATGNLLSVINVLMQLRKVCNHPNLFEVRPTVSPFQMEGIVYTTATMVYTALNYDPFKHISLEFMNLLFVEVETLLTAFSAHRIKKICVPKTYIEEIDKVPETPPLCPRGKVRINIRYSNNQHSISSASAFLTSKSMQWSSRSGMSPLLKTVPGIGQGVTFRFSGGSQTPGYSVQLVQQATGLKAIPVGPLGPNQQNSGASNTQQGQQLGSSSKTDMPRITLPAGFAQIVQTSTGRHLVLASPQILQNSGSQNLPTTTTTVLTAGGQRLTVLPKAVGNVATTSVTTSNRIITTSNLNRPVVRVPPLNISSAASQSSNLLNNLVTSTATLTTTVTSSITKTSSSLSQPMLTALVQKTRNATSHPPAPNVNTSNTVVKTEPGVDDLVVKTEPGMDSPQKKNLQDAETQSIFFLPKLEEIRQNNRKDKYCMMASRNLQRCEASPIYGCDLRASVNSAMKSAKSVKARWTSEGYVHCLNVHKSFCTSDEYFLRTVALSSAVHSAEQYVEELQELFSRFVFCVPAVSAPVPKIHVSHPPPSQLWALKRTQAMLQQELSSKCALLHPIASAMVTQFPDPRLIQYDCGKLQVLDRLLRQLKTDHHRVLIFTQMTRMLDVLEAFLNFHGHIYLRLDGTTRVDQRQVLMERFNADKRIFCFILSTRSGGIGVNLTGADTVIFYDSDWNPTMDAQAQDRCHRIGQTRDVHIYRLVSEMTVEENILKKANQKRLLGDLAIEGGNFTTAYFKSSTIQDLFNIDVGENDASRRMAEVLDRDSEKRRPSDSQLPPSPHEDKVALGALESALAAAEDETDVLAARTAKAEAAADLAEFDENIPLEEAEANGGDTEMSRAEQEVNNIMQQLTPVERYAMKFVEETDSAWSAEQLAAAEAEIEQQKREWELGRLQALKEEEERRLRLEDDDDQLLTFSREDSQNQIWISDNCKEQMPMWCPPTPPQDDNDVYIDHSIGFLYEQTVMSESQLPPIYVKKEQKRLRLDNSPANERESRRPLKMRHREESMFAPRSLFDRPTPAIIKMRRDMKLQKYRGIVRNPLSIPGVKPPLPTKQLPDQDTAPEWLIHEDWALLQAIQEYLDLPLNLTVLSPAHTPNWDFVADIVNNVSRTFRSAKQCRNRYEAVIIPREEGRLLYDVSPKKPKKNKNVGKPPPQTKTNRSMRTSQLYLQDNHGMYTRLYSHRFETIKSIANKKQSTTKPTIINTLRSTKHSTILAENGINYEVPLTPLDVAIKRAERIAKEKQKVVQAQLLSEQRRLQLQQLQQQQQSKQQMQQQLQQQQAQQQQQTAQAKGTLPTTTQQVSLGSVVTAPAASSSTAQAVVVGINPSQELLGANQVRAVTSSSGSLVTVASLNSAQVQVAAQRLATVSLPSQTQTVPVSTPTKAGGTMTATKPMSVQILRHMRQPGQHPHLHQQQLQQQQQQQQQQHRLASHQQLKVLQAAQAAGQGVTAGQKVSVAMTSGTVGGVAAVQVSQATAQRVQQFMNMKQAAAAAASAGTVKQTVSRTVTDSEMTAIIKRQQQQQLVAAQQKSQLQVASQPTLSQAQAHLLAQMQAGSSGQTQVATLVKAVSTPGGTTQSVTIPVTGMTLPQMKATFSPGAKGASPQQIRQLALHPQILQQRKLPMQKVAQLTQVTGKGGVPAQLIVQSPKAMPTTVTVQQIQQVIKQVPPQTVQHITHVSGGQAVVSQPSGSQMISHAVLTKGSQVPGAAQTLQTRVIPMSGNQQGLKQTIQVVTAGPGGRTSVPNVTIDSSGRPTVSVASTLASALAGTIKVTPSPAQQQAILSQVSAALQGQHVQQIRQPGSSPMRIQAVAVQQQGQALPAVIAQPTTSQTSSSQENQQ